MRNRSEGTRPWRASLTPSPRSTSTPMWEMSKTPQACRTAVCSATRPANCTAISQPAKGTSRPPAARAAPWRGVRRRSVLGAGSGWGAAAMGGEEHLEGSYGEGQGYSFSPCSSLSERPRLGNPIPCLHAPRHGSSPQLPQLPPLHPTPGSHPGPLPAAPVADSSRPGGRPVVPSLDRPASPVAGGDSGRGLRSRAAPSATQPDGDAGPGLKESALARPERKTCFRPPGFPICSCAAKSCAAKRISAV